MRGHRWRVPRHPLVVCVWGVGLNFIPPNPKTDAYRACAIKQKYYYGITKKRGEVLWVYGSFQANTRTCS